MAREPPTGGTGRGFNMRAAIGRNNAGGFTISLAPAQIAACQEAVTQLRKKLRRIGGGSIVDDEFDALQAERMRDYRQLLSRINVATQGSNRAKNRYVNVLPCIFFYRKLQQEGALHLATDDDTRVMLETTDKGYPTTSYINASYIQDNAHEDLPRYIATQGPLASTVGDFWLMVLQQQTPVIIMLTGVIDDNQEKCALYFPLKSQQSQAYGQIRVTTRNLTYSRHAICKREFEVENLQARGPGLNVVHYEYMDWPDHYVPFTTQPVRDLIREVYKFSPSPGPFVVHCSAGIGRTGTYCTIEHTLYRILRGDLAAIDLKSTVQLFRQQRDGMVQTREQYRFCYEAVEELEEYLSMQQRS